MIQNTAAQHIAKVMCRLGAPSDAPRLRSPALRGRLPRNPDTGGQFRRTSAAGQTALRLVLSASLLLVPVALRAEPQCLTAPYADAQTADQRVVASLLRGLHPVITASPSLTTALAEHRPVFCLDDLAEGVDGFFSVEETRIVLRRDLTPELQSVFLLHELRHLEQFGQGLCPSSGILSLEDHAFVLLALEADASAVSTLRAWQRLLEGDPGLWEVIVNWPSQADIAIRLGRAFFAGDSEAQMTAAAFEQWYLQEDRSQRYRSQTCHDYLESTAAKGAQPLHDLSIGEFLQRLCVLPDGASYGCIVPDDAADQSADQRR